MVGGGVYGQFGGRWIERECREPRLAVEGMISPQSPIPTDNAPLGAAAALAVQAPHLE